MSLFEKEIKLKETVIVHCDFCKLHGPCRYIVLKHGEEVLFKCKECKMVDNI